jgi:hypothetical protein
MAYEDKNLGTVLPERDGPAIGASAERRMLDAVGGADTIRTKLQGNPDGSTTLLKTRAGMPEFITSQAPGSAAAPCLRGPFEEKAAQFAKRKWHDPLPTLVSSDGLFRIPRAQLRKVTMWAGEEEPKKLIELHFASSAIGAQETAHNPLALSILESAYGDRLWHPKQMGRIVDKGLYFCMSRLRKLSLTCKKTNGKIPFEWWFSKEADPALSGALPICMNRNMQETGLATRLLHGVSQIKQFSLRLKDRAGAVIVAAPGGFLGGLDSPPVGGESEFPAIVNDAGQALNNLSLAFSCGQPWHGWMTAAGIETHTDPVNFPGGRLVTPPGYAMPAYGDTFYFSAPELPPVSESVPDDFAQEGMEYLKDVVFFGHDKRYSPATTSFYLGPNRWLHYGEESGKVHVLRVEVVGTVSRSSATIKVHDDGELTIRGTSGESREIGSFVISSPDTWTDPGASTTWGSTSSLIRPPWFRRDETNYWSAFVSSQIVSLPGTGYYLPLNASPTGDRVLVSHYRATKPKSDTLPEWGRPIITSSWEISVQDDLSAVSASKVWEVDTSDHSIGVSGEYWLEAILTELQSTTLIGEGTLEGSPIYFYVDAYLSFYRGYRFTAPSRVPYTELLMAGYTTSGTLVLTEAEYTYEYDEEELRLPEAESGTWWHSWTTAGAGHDVLQNNSFWGKPDSSGERIDFTDAVSPLRQVVQQWTPAFNRLRITDPSFTWAPAVYVPPYGTYRLPQIARYSGNVTMLRDIEVSGAGRSVFIAPESVAQASLLGYSGAGGFACYNPRSKEIRWSSGKLGCV